MTHPRIGPCFALALSLAFGGGQAHALDGTLPVERQSSALWGELGNPQARRARELLRQARLQRAEGDRLLPADWEQVCRRTLSQTAGSESHAALRGRVRALRQLARQAVRKRARVDNALARLRRAVALAPNDPELLFELAATLTAWEDPAASLRCEPRRRDAEALTVLERLQLESPQHRSHLVAHLQGILMTRQHRFADAADAQLRSISFTLDRESMTIAYYNLAEVTMLAGRFEDAEVYFRRSMATARSRREHLLPMWGLAVTLDRLGEHTAAVAQARQAVISDGGRMGLLRAPGIFFEPNHEIHYYEGLGHEGRAGDLEGVERLRALEAAAQSFRRFLTGAGDRGAFAADAADNLRGITEAIEAQRKELHRSTPTGR